MVHTAKNTSPRHFRGHTVGEHNDGSRTIRLIKLGDSRLRLVPEEVIPRAAATDSLPAASMLPQRVDVAIVGGGPAGLATACAILNRCPELLVRVFERGHEVPRKGAGLALYPNGVSALNAISAGLGAKVRSKACQQRVVTQAVDQQDHMLAERVLDWGERKPEEQQVEMLLPWYELTQALADELPPAVVQFDHHLVSLHLPDDAGSGSGSGTASAAAAAPAAGAPGSSVVQLGFKNGAAIEAGLVLGCDGFLSPVRRLWLKEEKGPVFSDKIIVRGRIPTAALKQLPAWSCGVDARSYHPGAGNMAMIYGVDNATSVWSITIPYTVVQERGLSYLPYGSRHQSRSSQMDGEAEFEEGAYQQALKVIDLYPPSLQQVVLATDAASCSLHGMYVHELEAMPERAFGCGPISLLGDAAHLMPVAGQGVNLALEDAAVLAYHVAREGPCEAAARAYETDQLPRVRRMVQLIDGRMRELAAATDAEDAERMRRAKRTPEYDPEVQAFHHPCLE